MISAEMMTKELNIAYCHYKTINGSGPLWHPFNNFYINKLCFTSCYN